MAGQNLGALTTTAPLSSSCVDELDVVYKVNTTPDGYYYLLNGPLEPASCYPSAYAGVTTQYYSPAVACPSGFTAACGSVNAIGTISETRYTCCPTQFPYQCQTTASYAWESTLGCVYPVVSESTTTWIVTEISSGSTYVTTSTDGHPGGMNAYSIQVRFQASDLTTATTTSTATSSQKSSTTAAVTGTNNDSPSSTSTSEASNSSGGLSTGAIAGIAVGAGLVGLAIIGTVAFLMIKKRKQQRELQQQSQGPPTQELDNNNKSTPAYNYYYSELDNGRPHDVHEAPA